MNIEQLIQHFTSGKTVIAGTALHDLLVQCSHEAMRVTSELNASYHSAEEIRELMSRLTGKRIDPSFTLFPPFYSDFGKNITIGKNVFINASCCFQDQGGISLGDGALIGHRVVLATINHGLLPDERQHNNPAPIVIGKNVWIGSGSIVLPGVTIGDNAVVAAGSVVTSHVEPGTVVAGVPARYIKTVFDSVQQPEHTATACFGLVAR